MHLTPGPLPFFNLRCVFSVSWWRRGRLLQPDAMQMMGKSRQARYLSSKPGAASRNGQAARTRAARAWQSLTLGPRFPCQPRITRPAARAPRLPCRRSRRLGERLVPACRSSPRAATPTLTKERRTRVVKDERFSRGRVAAPRRERRGGGGQAFSPEQPENGGRRFQVVPSTARPMGPGSGLAYSSPTRRDAARPGTAHRYGTLGQKQRGTDLIVQRENGDWWAFSNKRY
jgi:hypothetical protein